MSPEAPPFSPGDVLAGKYRIERVLGAGGMGIVVAARSIELGKGVAIKMMLPAALAMPRAVERFEREARAVVQLRSEHVAEVFDIGKLANGAPYIVMELLEGTDFEGLLHGGHRFEVGNAVELLLQACEAIAEAHALGIVHRDLKPKNLFLSQRLDGSPLVKVLDFGISKWTPTDVDSHALTRTSDVIGSPIYMSPEQVRSSKAVDLRTDIWSLGVILFELLAGRPPFVGESLPQLCAMVLEQEAPLLSTVRPDIPPALVAVVARCLEKDPALRFQSIAELAVALEPFAPPHARRASAYGRPPSGSPPHLSAPAFSETERSAQPVLSPHASTSGAPIAGSRTSVAWTESRHDGQRRRGRASPLVIASVVVAFLLVGGGVAVRSRVTANAEPAGAGAASPTAEGAASVLPVSPVSASAAASSMTLPPAASAATAATPARAALRASASATAPLRAAPRPSADAGPRASSLDLSAPTSDPLTPFDRK